MNIRDYIKIFNNYAKKYDLKNKKELLSKFHHSYRVMEYSKEIAQSLNLNEKDIFIAQLIDLFHDFGRFLQWEKYQTFQDHESIDHALLSIKEIENINMHIDSNIKDIVYKAIKNHNKFKIEDNLTEKEELFCKIIRDADKLDIMLEQGNTINKSNLKVNDDIFKNIETRKLLDNTKLNNEAEYILRSLYFIYDLNYIYSLKFVLDKRIIQNKINLLINNINDKRLEYIEKVLLDYVKERLSC